jgi:hypothetical protein
MRLTIRPACMTRGMRLLKLRLIDNLTLKQIGQRLGITGERVRQIEARAFRKMERAGILPRFKLSPHCPRQRLAKRHDRRHRAIASGLRARHLAQKGRSSSWAEAANLPKGVKKVDTSKAGYTTCEFLFFLLVGKGAASFARCSRAADPLPQFVECAAQCDDHHQPLREAE